MKTQYLKLCLVTQPANLSLPEYKVFLTEAVAGGVTVIQLRIKQQLTAAVLELALEIKQHLEALNTPLIINDHVELAKSIDAAGTHLGQSDMSPLQARKLLGPEKIIGWSVETIEQLHQANELRCIDYIAASAVFPSKTKNDCKTIWGIEGLKRLVALSRHPVVAIGGIYSHNVHTVMATGVTGVAVVSAVHDAADPRLAAQKISDQIDKGENNGN